MNTRQIEYIVAIAEEKNISSAAKKLYISQSTLSQALLNLEKELGIPLFIREQHGLIPTQAGEYYLQSAHNILDIKKQTYSDISKLSQTIRSRCRVGISSTEGMRRFLIASGVLQKQYLNIELYASEDHVENLYNSLKNNKLDIIIIASSEPKDSEFPTHVFRKEEILLALPLNKKEFLINDKDNIDWNILNRFGFIISKNGTTMRKIYDTIFNKHRIIPLIKSETDNIQYTLQMISDGVGCSLIPGGLMKVQENIEYLSLTPKEYRYQTVLYRPEHSKNKIMMDFVKMLEKVNLS